MILSEVYGSVYIKRGEPEAKNIRHGFVLDIFDVNKIYINLWSEYEQLNCMYI